MNHLTNPQLGEGVVEYLNSAAAALDSPQLNSPYQLRLSIDSINIHQPKMRSCVHISTQNVNIQINLSPLGATPIQNAHSPIVHKRIPILFRNSFSAVWIVRVMALRSSLAHIYLKLSCTLTDITNWNEIIELSLFVRIVEVVKTVKLTRPAVWSTGDYLRL